MLSHRSSPSADVFPPPLTSSLAGNPWVSKLRPAPLFSLHRAGLGSLTPLIGKPGTRKTNAPGVPQKLAALCLPGLQTPSDLFGLRLDKSVTGSPASSRSPATGTGSHSCSFQAAGTRAIHRLGTVSLVKEGNSSSGLLSLKMKLIV